MDRVNTPTFSTESVIRVISSERKRRPLLTQHQTYRCIALTDAVGHLRTRALQHDRRKRKTASQRSRRIRSGASIRLRLRPFLTPRNQPGHSEAVRERVEILSRWPAMAPDPQPFAIVFGLALTAAGRSHGGELRQAAGAAVETVGPSWRASIRPCASHRIMNSSGYCPHSASYMRRGISSLSSCGRFCSI